jgi:hypothetical protein
VWGSFPVYRGQLLGLRGNAWGACARLIDQPRQVNGKRGGKNFLKKGLYFFRCRADIQSTQGAQPPCHIQTMNTTRNRRYYAMQWLMNAVCANTGKRHARYYSFATASARDAWAEGGALYRGSGYRESLPASDSELRAELYRDRVEGRCGFRVECIG